MAPHSLPEPDQRELDALDRVRAKALVQAAELGLRLGRGERDAFNRTYAPKYATVVPTLLQAVRFALLQLEHDYQLFSTQLGREYCHACEAGRRIDGSWFHLDTCWIGRLLDAVDRER